MTSDLKRTAPVDTGELRRTTGAELTSATNRKITAEARVDVSYAEYVTKGTRPHVITPKRAGGVLVFKVGGKTVFATKVQHPGTEANDFFDKIVDDWKGYLNRAD